MSTGWVLGTAQILVASSLFCRFEVCSVFFEKEAE